jgi:hypothetical protein
MTHVVVLGTSGPQDFQIYDDDAPLDGTGLTLGIEWRTEPETPPTVAWLNQATGTVRMSGCEGLTRTDHAFRFTLTDGSNKVGYAPNGPAPNILRVVRV